MRLRLPSILAASLVLLLAAAPAQARDKAGTLPVPAHGVIGVQDAQLTPEFWIERLAEPESVVLDGAAIAAQNARLLRLDDSMHDLRTLPASLRRAQVTAWIEGLSQRPTSERFDVDGRPVPAATLDALVDKLALDAIPETQPTRYGLITYRAALRTFPTSLRVFNSQGETDIDRFQESALFPGTAVVIAHQSRDGDWLFVVSPRYAAWIKKRYVAEGMRAQVFGYSEKAPYRIVTGATERTVFSREQPQVSQLQLEMGVRVPLLTDWPPDQPVNGQHPYTAHVIELPIRGDDGRLAFAPALLPRIADSAANYLPLTRANLIRQSFKFLGERYGWGHAYNARDCSGFVSEIYRSMGVQLPRNTSDQSVSPALTLLAFDDDSSREQRMAAAQALQVGDLVYIPGHVMMVIGHLHGTPYVIHDTNGGSYLGADGELVRMGLNGVSVTPLLPMMFNRHQSYIDRMTSIVSPQTAPDSGR